MRILFVEKQIDYEPQGIMSMSSVLKEAGHEVALAICAQEDPLDVARAFEPGIIGYSVMTGSQQYYLGLNRHLKESLKHPFFAAFGGPHPTFFPEMVAEEGVDGLCVGEGEDAMVDLANALGNGGLQPDLLNWRLKIEGEVVANPSRALLRDLSDLPLPDRALIYDKHAYTRRSPIKHFLGGRGCPFNCTYCFNHAWYQIYPGQKRGYLRSVDHLLDELDMVQQRWPMEHVVFVDDLFILHLDWIEEFAEKYPRRIGLPFFCNVRANLVTPEKVALLKQAGCVTASMGIETANDHIRNVLLKRKMSREQMVRAGRTIREGGLNLTSTNILALPTSTLQDDLDTMKLNTECQVSYAHAFLFQPYPGTELGKFTEQNNLMIGSFEDIGSIAWDRSIILHDAGEQHQFEHLQRWFAMGAEFPWLTPLIRLLIRLPHNRFVDTLYWWIHKLWKGYVIRKRVHPTTLSLHALWSEAKHFMKQEA